MKKHLGSSECFAGEKKVYRILFNEHTNYMNDTIAKREKGDITYMPLIKDNKYAAEGYLMVFTNDLGECLKELQEYGGGIKKVEYIGQAFCRVYPKEVESG